MTSMRERFAATTTALLDEDERTVVVLAEISLSLFDRAFRAHPDRVVNVGIMEQTMIGVAAGFAMEGFHPIVHTIAPFLVERPFEQLKVDFGYQGLGGTFVSIGASYDYSIEGATHHAPGDVQAMLSIPGMRVVVPGHPDEVDRLLRATVAGPPTYMRTTIEQNAEPLDVLPDRVHVVRLGSVATIVAVGPMLSRTLEAVDELDVSVLYATMIEPFDREALRGSVPDGSTLVIVEPCYEGTTALAIAPAIQDRAVRLVSIGVPRRFLDRYGRSAEHELGLGLDAAGIRRRVDTVLRHA